MSDPVHDYLAEIGRKGGAAGRGPTKARTSEQAQAAARARWGTLKKRAKRSPNASRLPPQRSGGRQDAVVGHSGIGNNEQKGKAT